MTRPSFIGAQEWELFEQAFQAMEPCTHGTTDPDRFRSLWSSWEFDAVCRFVPLPDPADFRLVRAGKLLPPPMYQDASGAVSLARVEKLRSSGVSSVLVSLDCYSDRLHALSRDLEAALQCAVQINLYVTPGNSQALGEHVDRHDVLVLQVSGEKTWDIAATEVRGAGAARVDEKRRVVLRGGSWLYVPKGVPHEVRNEGTDTSVHLTVGFYPLTWSDVLQEALESSRLVARPLMERIPLDTATAPTDAELQTRLAALRPHLDLAAARRHYSTQFPRLAAAPGPPAARAEIEAIDPQTRLAWRQREVSFESAKARLRLNRPGRRFPLPLHPAWEPVLDRMRTVESFCAAELADGDSDQLLPLCRLLANVGVLAIAGSASPASPR